MKTKLTLSIITLCLTFSFLPLNAEEKAKIKDEQKTSEEEKENPKKKKKSGFLPFAVPYYSPDTSAGIGFMLLYYNNPSPDNPGQKQNEISLLGGATLKKQFSILLSTDVYFHAMDYKLSGEVGYSRFPDLFWGIGPDTRESMEEKFSSNIIFFKPNFMFKITKDLYLGPAYTFEYDHMYERDRYGQLKLKPIRGRDGTMISGVGININWDTRDSIFYPRRGFYIDIKGYMYRKEIGSEYNFNKLEVDVRYFQKIYNDHVFAVQGKGIFSNASVPFEAMPKLGGDMILRGYLDGRYRDKNYIALQAEYRFPLAWRFAGALFGAIGQVGPTVKTMSFYWDDMKATWGLGLRFIADRDQHITFRLDAGFNKNFDYKKWNTVPEIYFMIKESF